MRRQLTGFSIIELMVVLTVAGVILAIGVPSFNGQIKNSRLTSSVNDLVGAMHLSRSEASKRGTPVVMCASNNALNQGAESCTNHDWNEGRGIFDDNDGDGALNGNVDAIIQTQSKQSSGLGIIADEEIARTITYMPDGFAQLPLGADSDRYIVYCVYRTSGNDSVDESTGDDKFSRVLALSNSGRPRILSRDRSDNSAPSCE